MTNWQLIITLATLVLAIFGANQISIQVMNKQVEDLKMNLDARFDAVEQRIGALEQRVERIERQLETLFARFLPKSGD
jgi:chaperonin cofactor prefoldin